VNWYVSRDYDQLYYAAFAGTPAASTVRIWMDDGLVDENGGARLGLWYWAQYLAVPRSD
jgi:hypothetical protein